MVHKSGELFVRIIYLAFMLFVVEMKFLFLKCYYQWFKELTLSKNLTSIYMYCSLIIN